MLCLDINGMKTISTPQVTLRGITIDVDNLCNLARRKTGALMRLRKKLTTDKKLLLYNSFIKFQFGYCPCVWMFHGKSTVNKVNRIKKGRYAPYIRFHVDL